MMQYKGTHVPTTVQARHIVTDAQEQLQLDTNLFKYNLFYSIMICTGELI